MLDGLKLNEIIPNNLPNKITATPLQFEWQPGDFLCNEHQYRIYYLGPRFIHTAALHKKYASTFNSQYCYHPLCQDIPKYEVKTQIVQSYSVAQKMRTNSYYKSNVYYRAFEGMNPTLQLEGQYIFNSFFESGNLDCVIKISQDQYDLFLRIDSNTRGHTNWFYFSIKNGNKMNKIKLNICNLKKIKSLYQNGMKPYIFSRKKYQTDKTQWEQNGKNNGIKKKQLRYKFLYKKINVPVLYCLQLEYQFQYENDQVFFAYCIPYTYSQMIHSIYKLPNKFAKIETIGISMSGVAIPAVHICNHQQKKNKKNVFITGRVHSAESNSSHILTGFMDYLCSNAKQAEQLRNRVNFIIVPMINPDGVIIGNSRTSAAGKDLNREYLHPNPELYPQVQAVKSVVKKLKNKYGLLMYFDFHGHSRKKNTFLYGPPYLINEPQYYKCRIIPRLIERLNNSFRFYSCSFNISENKKTTARAVMLQQLKIPYTYTIQSSIGYYYDSQKMATYQFDRVSWNKMGTFICKGLSQFFTAYQIYQSFLQKKRKQREKKKLKKIAEKLMEKQKEKRKDIKITHKQEIIVENNINTPIKQAEQQIFFIEMIEQVKQLAQLQKQQPQQDDESSDDHDSNQDFEPSKMQQFNNLLIQKQRVSSTADKLLNIDQQQLKAKRKSKRKKQRISQQQQQQQKQQQINKSIQIDFINKFSKKININKCKKIIQEKKKQIKNNQQDHAIIKNKYLQYQQPFIIQKKSIRVYKLNQKQIGSSKNGFTKILSKYFNTINNHNNSNHIHQSIEKDMFNNYNTITVRNNLKLKSILKSAEHDQKTQTNYKQQFNSTFAQGYFGTVSQFRSPNSQDQDKFNKKISKQFKFQDILTGLNQNSKNIKQSIKWKRQKQQLNNTLFPSTFYGIKSNKLCKKKRMQSLLGRNQLQQRGQPLNYQCFLKIIKK